MPRFFLEVAYKGTQYSGFQVQQNAITIQSEIEKAILVLQKEAITLTGSSRTDAGVHALQNYFHFDYHSELHPQFIYKLNAILPADIVLKSLTPVNPDAHCRFDAVSRSYTYNIYRFKNPFLQDRAYYYPYRVDIEKLNQAAAHILSVNDFTTFSKRNTQVKTFKCSIYESEWLLKDDLLTYSISGNRFLRGMVRALTATMLKVGRNTLSFDQFRDIIDAKDCTKASFAVPAHGLFLTKVNYPGMTETVG